MSNDNKKIITLNDIENAFEIFKDNNHEISNIENPILHNLYLWKYL